MNSSVSDHEDDFVGEEASLDEIEAAYARALDAVDAVERAVPELQPPPVDPDPVEFALQEGLEDSSSAGDSPDGVSTAAVEQEAVEQEPVLRPRQIIEAALFVGGGPLPLKQLGKLLGGESLGNDAEQQIAELNIQYGHEARPYEIRLAEGGYQLVLREEFERIRNRVYGQNPKEIKLSQEALEVLALVAYRQPLRCDEIVEAGKQNASTILRQLIRRQLVSVQRRDDGDSKDVTYATTSRFLEVFGLRNLDELPFPEDLVLK